MSKFGIGISPVSVTCKHHAAVSIRFGDWRVSMQLGSSHSENATLTWIGEDTPVYQNGEKIDTHYAQARAGADTVEVFVLHKERGFSYNGKHDGVFGGLTPYEYSVILEAVSSEDPKHVRNQLRKVDDGWFRDD